MSDIRRFELLWEGKLRLSVGSASNALTGWVSLDMDERARPLVVGNACALPFRDGSFEFLLASHVLEHIADPFPAVAEAWRVLRPGGLLLVVVPHALSYSYIIPPQHVRAFVPDTFRYFLDETYDEPGHGYGARECRTLRSWTIEKLELTTVPELAWWSMHFPRLTAFFADHLFGLYQDIYCLMRKSA